MLKQVLETEKEYLNKVQKEIEKIKAVDKQKYKQNLDSIAYFKNFFSENFYDIKKGDDELAYLNLQIENLETQNNNLQNEIKRLTKQKSSPYFGRFDFQPNGENKESYYIGLGLIQNSEKQNFVYDWRSDISSLYYEDKLGLTSYICPDGEIAGELSLKRQFKIENGELKYYLDSHMVIDDDILMEQLSKNASSKMHEIASTIQKEQNILIRDERFENTIVQGVAGSGKTSIAMHRVSYLLYKYRNQLKSEDILILSPTELFGDYIKDVLPALGEEKPYSTTFSNMAKRLLGLEFETRDKLLERVIQQKSQKDFNDIAIKSSFEFLNDLKNFLNNDICNLFVPKTLVFGEVVLPQEEIADIYFNKLTNLPIYKRIDVLAENIADRFKVSSSNREDLVKRARKILYNKFITTDLLKIYNLFLRSLDLDEVEKIGAYDVAPILLIKENLFSLSNHFNAKYVVVDEMQDYTPTHFYLFDKIWRCAKLYLGDIYQSIDRTLSPEYLTLLAKQTKSKLKVLNKAYRSTLEIAQFSQKILGKHIANNVNRSGEQVHCIKTTDCALAIEKIVKQSNLKNQSVAIICKDLKEIQTLQNSNATIKKFKFLSEFDAMPKSKKIITTCAKAKGVEFDCVIIPFCDNKNYSSELDRNLLYVSATRALHKLYFVSSQTPSKFVTKKQKV